MLEICKCRAQLIPNGDWTRNDLWTQAALGGVFRAFSPDRRLPRLLPPAECSGAAFFLIPCGLWKPPLRPSSPQETPPGPQTRPEMTTTESNITIRASSLISVCIACSRFRRHSRLPAPTAAPPIRGQSPRMGTWPGRGHQARLNLPRSRTGPWTTSPWPRTRSPSSMPTRA